MGNVAFDFMNMYLSVHLKSWAKPSIYKTINYGLPTKFWEGNVSSRVCPPVSHSVHRDHGALHLTVQGLRPPIGHVPSDRPPSLYRDPSPSPLLEFSGGQD